MRDSQAIKLFLVILLSVSYVVSFSNFGVLAFERVMKQEDQFLEKTLIGNVDVSGMDKREALEQLTLAQEEWIQSTNIELFYKEKQLSFDFSIYQFQLEETVNSAISGKGNRCLVTMNEEDIADFQTFINNEDELDTNKLKHLFISFAEMLESGSYIVRLEQYLTEPLNEDEILSEVSIQSVNHLQHIQRWVNEFTTIEIKPQSRFSLLQTLSDNDVKSYPKESLSMIASALYKVLLPTNFIITERHLSERLPSDIELGFDAVADITNKLDFVALNPNDYTYKLESQIINNALHVTLKGPSYLYTYNVVIEDKQKVNWKTVVQYDPALPLGQKRIAFPGEDGLMMKLFRITKDETGVEIDKELITEDYYPPRHRIEVRSLIEKETEKERENDELEESDDRTEEKNDDRQKETEIELDVQQETKETDQKPADEQQKQNL